jgi:hypothetical protein
VSGAPDRLTVPACIGCGAMSRPGTCEMGCREQRLDLVRGAAYDELAAVIAASSVAVQELLPIAEQLASEHPEGYETAYRSVQDRARAALLRCADVSGRDDVLAEASEPATTWWCPQCGGIDAPQECLGICVWRPVEWVGADAYRHQREHALSERAIESRLRALARRVVSVTPREGQWERCWLALQTEARDALDVCDDTARIQ